MSLFRKIRRRHKAFVLRRSKQIHGEDAAFVFPVDDGEGEDEDEDAGFMVNSSQQSDEQNVYYSAGPESHQNITSCMEHVQLQADNPSLASIIIAANSGNEVDQYMQIAGKENRFWFCIAKTAALLLITAGAFCVGMPATVGLTMTVALAFKLLARDRVKSNEGSTSAKAEQSCRSNKNVPPNAEIVRPDSKEIAMIGSKAPVEQIGSDLVTEAVGPRSELLEIHDAEALEFKASGDSLLAQRKKLRRLNCMKIPPSTSSFTETMEYSPSSSTKASPRSWFHNVRKSTRAEMENQGKLKSKVLLRRLRKSEPLSAPSSPLNSSHESSSNLGFIASDGSDTGRSTRRMPRAHRRSKFRPASPAEVTNVSMGLSSKQIYQTLPARKGKRAQFPATLLENEAIATDAPKAAMQKHEMEASTFMPAGPKCLTTEVRVSTPSEMVETRHSTVTAGIPTVRDISVKVDIHGPLSSTHELSHQTKEKCVSLRRPVTPISQEGLSTKAVTRMNQGSVSEWGKMWRKHSQVGSPWVAAGFMIMLAGLFVGRMMAVTGLVCYWYLLSLSRRKV